MLEPIISVKNLSVRYYGKKVLDDISFSVKPGEILTVLGGSGSGKTTLMRQLIGIETPLKGSVTISGICLTTSEPNEIKKAKKQMGVMFQSGALLSAMTLLENVMLPLTEHTNLPPELVRYCALKKLMLVGLQEYAHYYPTDVSGGMIKRAAIARAMALDPSVIVLDEPGAGLDPITSNDIDQLILQLSKSFGITFIVITHELASIQKIADKVLILNQGKVVAEGTLKEVINHSTNSFVKQFFSRIINQYQDDL